VRINAEDPAGAGASRPRRALSPASTSLRGPACGLDAGYMEGDTVSQYYDNLIANSRCGTGREKARLRLLRAIEETVIEGVATTLPADVVILTNEKFVNATHSTTGSNQNWTSVSCPVTATRQCPVGEGTVRKDVTAEVNGGRVQCRAVGARVE